MVDSIYLSMVDSISIYSLIIKYSNIHSTITIETIITILDSYSIFLITTSTFLAIIITIIIAVFTID